MMLSKTFGFNKTLNKMTEMYLTAMMYLTKSTQVAEALLRDSS